MSVPGAPKAVLLARLAPVEHPDGMEARVHPKYMTRYCVTNWREDEQGLVQRGDETVWLSPGTIEAMMARPSGPYCPIGAPRPDGTVRPDILRACSATAFRPAPCS